MASLALAVILLTSVMCCHATREVPNNNLNRGVLRLIVKAFVDDLLSQSTIEDEVARSKLYHLGDHISTHPALRQKHLYVGQEPPNYDPDKMRSGRLRSLDSIHKRAGPESAELLGLPQGGSPQVSTPATSGQDKVSKSQFPSEEICITDRQWEQINETNDFYDNKVEIVQEEGLQQFVFTYRCANAKGACTGISPFYHSECTERFGWVYMYYRKSSTEQPQWGYVAAPHHCACKIQPTVVTEATKKRKKK